MQKKMAEQIQITEKVQVSCKWKLKDLFDHRHCRSRMKFLTNSDNKQKNVNAAGNLRDKSNTFSHGNNCNKITNVSENKGIAVDDIGERNVAKLNQENGEMHKFALEILDSNSDLFLKLLRNPDSVLLNRIQNAKNLQQAKKETVKLLYENQLAKSCSNAIPRVRQKPEHTTHKSIMERIKSQYGCPSTDIEVRCTSNSIVVLRSRRKKHERDTFRKHKDMECSYRPEIATATQRVDRELKSPRANYVTKREMEAKMHICKMLKNAEKTEELSAKQGPRTLKSILLSPLSSPEHEISTPCSRRTDGDDSMYSQKMRFSTCKKTEFACKISLPFQNEEVPTSTNYKKLSDQFQNLGSCAKILEPIDSADDDLSSEASVNNMEMSDTIKLADSDLQEVPYKQQVFVNSDERSFSTPKLCNENGYLEFSIQDFQLENSKDLNSVVDASSSNPSREYKVEIKNGSKEKEQSSQNSELEALLTKDFTSLGSNINHPDEPLMHPLHPDSKNDDAKASLSTEIQNVIQTSGLNCEELSKKLHSSVHLLNPCSSVEHKLFSDFIKCILLELFQYHFECQPRASFIRPSTLASSVLTKNEKNEFLKEIQWYLVPPAKPRRLEDLAVKDVTKSGNWSSRRLETEEVVIQLANCMLNELILQAIFIIQED